ncbi:MAG: hypothetical protein J0H39_13865 [Alphaproteobacteria bacterium]|nr:hypothetical protein [Alphaproteobacteria bacterium]
MNVRRSPIDVPRALRLKAQGVTNAQIAERFGCSAKALSVMIARHRKAERMREGDVMIVHRVPRGVVTKLPKGFKLANARPAHHDQHAVLATKIQRKRKAKR